MSTNTSRPLRAVPDQTSVSATPRTDAERKLWQALLESPGSTATALSGSAGIGKSTAPKILARWEKDGLVARTTGIADGGSRPADRWSITADDQPTQYKRSDEQRTDDTSTANQSHDDQPKVTADAGVMKSARLAPGALRGLVEDHLRDQPGDVTPNAIGKALNRSAGAVHNALEKLVESGYAVRTSDKPKKYALLPSETTATPK